MSLRSLLLIALSSTCLALLAGPGRAQCLTPDGLDGGPCCGIAGLQIPIVPNFVQDAQDICWRDCAIDQVSLVRGRWKKINVNSAGIAPPCGEQRMRLDIITTSNVLLWRGNMRLLYSRTFVVVDTNGLLRQVWRFLVNGDLTNYPAAGPAPCPVPPCAASFGNKTFFTGYVDFAQDCSIPGGGWDTAWMLTHACDAFDHHAGFPRAGAFHPDRSYTFVGPAAGFVPGPLQPIEGTLSSSFDSVRERVLTTAPTTVLCTHEEPVVHTLTPQNQLCPCGAPGSNQFMVGDLNVQGPCGASVRNPPVGPLLPGYVSMGIGAWTNPSVYPGQQALRWSIGGYDVVDNCAGFVQHNVYYGVTTLGGLQAFEMLSSGPGGPLPPVFIDQSSSQTANGTPVMNRPHTSYYLMALNH